MADTCLWRSWESRIEWDAVATVPQDVRTRLAAFLTPVWAAIADLAGVLTDATDADLVAVLGAHVPLRLPRPTRPRRVAALAGIVGDRLEAALDGPDVDTSAEARLHVWLLAVNRALKGNAPAIQFAIVAVFLERVLRVRLAGPDSDDTDDTDALDHAAEVLAVAMGELLHEVGSRAIPPEAYHVM
jgi:hypothetical protein